MNKMDNTFKHLSTYIHSRLEFIGLLEKVCYVGWKYRGYGFDFSLGSIMIKNKLNLILIEYYYQDENLDYYFEDRFESNDINQLYRYIDFIFNHLMSHHPESLYPKPTTKF